MFQIVTHSQFKLLNMSLESINVITALRPTTEYKLNPTSFISISPYAVGSIVNVLGKENTINFTYPITCILNNANNRLYIHFANAEYISRSSIARLLSVLGFSTQTAFVRAVFFNVTYNGQKVTSTLHISSFISYRDFILYTVPT